MTVEIKSHPFLARLMAKAKNRPETLDLDTTHFAEIHSSMNAHSYHHDDGTPLTESERFQLAVYAAHHHNANPLKAVKVRKRVIVTSSALWFLAASQTVTVIAVIIIAVREWMR